MADIYSNQLEVIYNKIIWQYCFNDFFCEKKDHRGSKDVDLIRQYLQYSGRRAYLKDI